MSILIHIDDQEIQVEKGITILQAARQNEIEIPTLCDFPGLPSHGSCRMCVVEIQGRPNMPTSCTTPVEEGMVIYTHSPKVHALRSELLQMLLSEHPSGCLFCPEKAHCDECMVTLRKAAVTTGCSSCPKDDQCELQTLAEKYNVEKPGYPVHYRMIPVEKYDPFYDRDYNLCILCGRCIRVCEDLHFDSTLAYTRRGTHTLVGTSFYRSHLESSCTFCGACVEVCPTGALSEKTRKWSGAHERETASTCPLCSIGCQINLLSKKETIIGSLPNHLLGEAGLCVKGRFGITELVNHPTRLKHPQTRVEQTWMATGWEEAIHIAAEKLAACPPEHFEMQISASCTNEDLYVAARFTREVMKSNNLRIPALARYGTGMAPAARLLQRSQPLEIIQKASAILCLGLEDKYAQSVVEIQLHRARQKGARIIALGERRMPWSSHADVWLKAEAGQEAELVQKLVERINLNATGGEESSPLARATHWMHRSDATVIVLGPTVLSNESLLQSVESLTQTLNARVVILPEQANLAGILWLDLLPKETGPAGQALDVLYLIGEMVPKSSSGHPFILFQNLYPSTADASVDLMLPAAAFSEEEGTFIDSARRVRAIHSSVRPAGEALPNWLILSKIAQAMGVQDFEYNSVDDIRAEIPGLREALEMDCQMNQILENKMLVPNLHQITLSAPEIACSAQPGQFVIVRVEEDGERIPLSIADWDAEARVRSPWYI
jgi:predicted molibdopterin-dependent oxidoreductase YjgC